MAAKTPEQQKAYEDQIMAEYNRYKANEKPVVQTPEMVAHSAAVEAFKQANWQNGGTTVTGTTGAQNLNAVIGQAGNTVGQSANIQGIQAQAAKDTQMQAGGSGTAGGGGTGSGGSVSTSQPTDNGIGNAQNYINQLNDLRKNAALSALQKSHDAALSNLGSEKSAIQPKYYDQRNQVAAGAQQQARNFAEYMAARGGTNSGANAQATLTNNMTTQGSLGTLGRQEAAAYTDIERRTSDLNNAYQSDIATTTANAEADKMSALLDDYYKAQQRGDTLAQNQIQNAIAQSQLTMQQQGQTFNQDLATKQFNYNVSTDSRDFDYKKAQDSWNQTFQKEQYNDQKAAQLWEQTFKTKSFEQDMKDAAAARGLQWATLSQRDKEFVADSAYRDKTYEADQKQRGVENTLNQDKLNWDKDPKNPSNITKPAPGPSDSEIKNNSFAEYTAAMDSLTPAERKKAITEEKNNLIKEFGPTGYNQFYDLYFDKYGNPK